MIRRDRPVKTFLIPWGLLNAVAGRTMKNAEKIHRHNLECRGRRSGIVIQKTNSDGDVDGLPFDRPHDHV